MQIVQEVQPPLSQRCKLGLLTNQILVVVRRVVRWGRRRIVGHVVAMRTERPDAVTADMKVGVREMHQAATAETSRPTNGPPG